METGRNTWGGLALLLALFWSPLAGCVALFFALDGQEAHRAGDHARAASDARIAGLFCVVALLAGGFEWTAVWLVQAAVTTWL